MFVRHPVPGWHSIEGLFETVRNHLPADVRVKVIVLENPSRRILPRIKNIFQAHRERGMINHVTGDVHYITLGLPRSNTVLTVADLGGLSTHRGIRRWILKILWYQLPVGRAAATTVISDFTHTELARLLPQFHNKIRTIPVPLADAFSQEGAVYVQESRCQQDGRPTILCVGTTANKNLIRVFEALDQVDVKIQILGHLNDEQTNALKMHKLAYTSLRDLSQQEVVDVYRRSTLLLFPSTYEGFGMPIVEAQSLGIPVITSNREPMRSVAGDAALLVNPDNTEDIRLAVERLTRDVDLRHRLISAGLANSRRFTAATIANQYASVYRRVAMEATPREAS